MRRARKSTTAPSSCSCCSWLDQAATPAATMHVPAWKAQGWLRSQLQLLFRPNLSSRQAAAAVASTLVGAPAAAAGLGEPGPGLQSMPYPRAVFLQAGQGIRCSCRHHSSHQHLSRCCCRCWTCQGALVAASEMLLQRALLRCGSQDAPCMLARTRILSVRRGWPMSVPTASGQGPSSTLAETSRAAIARNNIRGR